MISRRDRGGQAGFTLMEILVSLAIIGLLTTLTATGFRVANDGWQRILARDNQGRELQAARQFVRDLLAQARPEAVASGGADALVAFDGRRDRITFLAPLAQRFRAGDIVAYTLWFAEDGTLWVAWRLDRDVDEGFARNREEKTAVLSGLIKPEIAYYGAESKDEAPRWGSAWQGKKQLPTLIRLRMMRDEPRSDFEQDMIVAPLITASPCALDGRQSC